MASESGVLHATDALLLQQCAEVQLLAQVGAVLGKSGCTITRIRADSGATVRLVALDADEEKHLPKDVSSSGQHRVISIAGSADSMLRAIAAVTDILQDFQVNSLFISGLRRPDSDSLHEH